MGGPKSVVGACQPPLIGLSPRHDLIDREQAALPVVGEYLRVVETSADKTPLEHVREPRSYGRGVGAQPVARAAVADAFRREGGARDQQCDEGKRKSAGLIEWPRDDWKCRVGLARLGAGPPSEPDVHLLMHPAQASRGGLVIVLPNDPRVVRRSTHHGQWPSRLVCPLVEGSSSSSSSRLT